MRTFQLEIPMPGKSTESSDCFNPFIHGTNSLILPILSHTALSIMSPIEMIKKYSVAPLGGEITQGGYQNIFHKEMGLVSFGRLKSNGVNDYTLDKIIDRYTQFKMADKKETTARWYADNTEKLGFVNINVFLIMLVSRMMQGEECLLTRNQLDFMEERINAVIQIYYLELIMGKYIHPDLDLLSSLEKEKRLDIFYAIRGNLVYEHLARKITESRVNIEDIYRNPSGESLAIIEEMLVLPKNSRVLTGEFIRVHKDVTIEETRIFTSRKPQYPKRSEMKCTYPPIAYALSVADELCGVDYLLEQFARKRAGHHFLRRVEKDIEQVIDTLRDRISLIRSVVENYDKGPRLDMSLSCVTDPFPMILLYEENANIHKIDSSHNRDEYRADAPLMIGKDIRMIATDTQRNARRLYEFFIGQGIDLEIILFDQLREAKQNGKRPIAMECSQIPEEPMVPAIVDELPQKSNAGLSASFSFFGRSIYHASKKFFEYGEVLLGYKK